jgi:hypothetical protein
MLINSPLFWIAIGVPIAGGLLFGWRWWATRRSQTGKLIYSDDDLEIIEIKGPRKKK